MGWTCNPNKNIGSEAKSLWDALEKMMSNKLVFRT